MAIKQRKGKTKIKSIRNSTGEGDGNYTAGKDKKLPSADKKDVKPRKSSKKKLKLKDFLLFTACFSTIVGGILYYFYCQYGISLFVPRGARDYKLSPYQWRNFIDSKNKSILLIGGPHRSGTTIVWKAITEHPDVVGFGDKFETGVDYSEGVLFQDVYPRFGVGLEFKMNFGQTNVAKGEDEEKAGGLGRYALLPEHKVHWTKENRKELLEDPKTLSRLLNRFAPFWDKNKKFGRKDGLNKAKVWVEKSPQNGVLTTFLEGIYNMPVLEDGTVDTSAPSSRREDGKTSTKFLFMTRHPIANIYAIDHFVKNSMGGYIDFEILLRNYIQLHKYMKMDENALDSPSHWVRLEDFTGSPGPSDTLKSIFSFLDVSTDGSVISEILEKIGTVNSDPNAKYMTEWCTYGIQKHGYLLEKYADELNNLNLGYDIDVCAKDLN